MAKQGMVHSYNIIALFNVKTQLKIDPSITHNTHVVTLEGKSLA